MKEKIYDLNDLILKIDPKALRKAKRTLLKGYTVNPDRMEYIDLYATMCLASAAKVSMSDIRFAAPLKKSHVKDISGKFPYKGKAAGVEFTLERRSA